ncbi:MAG TPA: DUF1800 domain-containing protein [Gemmataceae bacterium]|nr:DUF1800 domain-containing protein [Gemmataceae bacterium]
MKLASAWAPYIPDARSPWNLRRVVHLHRRAGFGATWGEIQRDLKDGPKLSIDRLLAGKTYSEGVPAEFESTAALLRDSATSSKDPSRLKAWWIYRMLFGPDPLTERLVLMWHNHFATSNLKVDDLEAMRNQNDVSRKWARAPFGELLNAIVRDRALLFWLDATANRKGHPNENLGRELMELFTLGVGHYTETDVKEAARALTGWGIGTDGQFQHRPLQHDDGDKTILGNTGRWSGDDLVQMLLESPATASRLALRLCEQFMGECSVDAAAVAELASGLREHNLDIGWAVEIILRSQAFFADRNIKRRIVGPVEFVVGPIRALELFDPPPSTLVLAEWIARLGQDLFYPPNVGGWSGGRTWLTTRSLIARTNYASALVLGSGVGRTKSLDAVGLALRHGAGNSIDSIVDFFARLLLGLEPDKEWRDRFMAALGPRKNGELGTLQNVVGLMLATPEAQVA